MRFAKKAGDKEMRMNETVAIIGAGVSGLTCGVLFAEKGYGTEIFAAEIGSKTTSAAAAAIWFPYDAEPLDAVIAWSLQSLAVFQGLCGVRESGVAMIELRCFARAGDLPIPPWSISLGAKRLTKDSIPKCFSSGFGLNVPRIDTTRYLDYLATRFCKANGHLHEGIRFEHLEDLDREFGVIINCSGTGAAHLVPDPEVEPHRGQVVLVPKIAQQYAVVSDDSPLMYAIPREQDCVFGGTNELSAKRDADPAQTTLIIEECSRVLEIKPPRILGERVGLRPFRRAGICLRAERLRDGRRAIHNYGHGGSGFTLSWGCARAVLDLAETR
jgi:D-amino-acid oxidase